MWQALSAQHLEQASDNLYDLQARFYQYQYNEGNDMKTHIADIKAIAHHLGEVDKAIEERELITKIVCTLPAPYRHFVSSWRHNPVERQTMVSLTSLLLQEEREIGRWAPKGGNSHESALHAQQSTSSGGGNDQPHRAKDPQRYDGQDALYAHPSAASSYHDNRSNSKRGGRGNYRHQRDKGRQSYRSDYQQSNRDENQHDRSTKRCDYCQMDNHNTADCNTKKRHERTDKEREQMAKRVKKEPGKKAVTSSATCFPLEDQDYSLVSVTPRFDTRSNGDWFADSGATQHMTDQREWLTNFINVPDGSWAVKGIGSSSYPVRGSGDVQIWITTTDGVKKPATIKGVLYVPGLGTNLFSIAAATDLGWMATFTGTNVHFSSANGNCIMSGERVGRTLYLLAINPRNEKEVESSVALSSSISPGLSTWHRRLAHVSYNTILKMASSRAVDGLDLANTIVPSEPCTGCSYGKHQRHQFPIGRNRATYTGQLIHSDLCGPMERATPSGALYFVLFIDDYSGWRFIYFLRYKSDAASKFMELINVIRGETGNLVRTLRTDGGGEWSSNVFAEWLTRKGIRHESSAPHTPEQDGVSERGIRTVTEGARSCLYDLLVPSEQWGEQVSSGTAELIKDCRLPVYLWAEAANFTVYSLNRVLCKASSPITPFEAYHNKRPNLSHLRVFGSIAFVHIPKAERRKLDQKSYVTLR